MSMSDAAADAFGRNFVHKYQFRFPDWMLMYSLRDRGILAFYCGACAPGGIVVGASRPEQLLRLMSDAVHAQWQDRRGSQIPRASRVISEKPSVFSEKAAGR
ncbi:hypothetical protein HCN51_44450 [Nonomuraea sp. FMUSA5-5]|uniref:Uncharacterized protein n=1 Tax=Nonomuraea composti TaxID=2720023 RepID=A0ABX1BMQ7_9ACTN|nr:hypothetical protein [Nonomuraea sp. FMUSA5-5]NJP96408.1 hypothetical protein [Nonomuraea sp. FMUSA5-5]